MRRVQGLVGTSVMAAATPITAKLQRAKGKACIFKGSSRC